MAGRSDPPEGTPPEGLPNSGDDDYRSVVFDESFVRAARLQEFSASERTGDHAPAVRPLPPVAALPTATGNGRRQALLMVLVVVLALGTAVYMGVRRPGPAAAERHPELMRATVIPLAPTERVPGGEPAELFLHSPAAQFRTGAEGVQLPVARGTRHFSESQVLAALTIAKDYLVQSSLDPGVLTGGAVRPVRLLLDPDQHEQFDTNFFKENAETAGAGGTGNAGRTRGTDTTGEAGTGTRADTGTGGWLVRFDPDKVALAGAARVNGTLKVIEIAPDILDVISDHTFVYPLRPTAAPDRGRERADTASLFTVRRELQFRYDAEDLRRHRTELLGSYAAGGPQACGASTGATHSWHPMLAGSPATATASAPRSAPGSLGGAQAGTDPYATGTTAGTVCGILAARAMPSPGSPGPATAFSSGPVR